MVPFHSSDNILYVITQTGKWIGNVFYLPDHHRISNGYRLTCELDSSSGAFVLEIVLIIGMFY